MTSGSDFIEKSMLIMQHLTVSDLGIAGSRLKRIAHGSSWIFSGDSKKVKFIWGIDLQIKKKGSFCGDLTLLLEAWGILGYNYNF